MYPSSWQETNKLVYIPSTLLATTKLINKDQYIYNVYQMLQVGTCIMDYMYKAPPPPLDYTVRVADSIIHNALPTMQYLSQTSICCHCTTTEIICGLHIKLKFAQYVTQTSEMVITYPVSQ